MFLAVNHVAHDSGSMAKRTSLSPLAYFTNPDINAVAILSVAGQQLSFIRYESIPMNFIIRAGRLP